VPVPVAERLRNACAGPLPELLPAHPQVSLTHGDLWFGNVVAGRWVVDPAVCYADRELDLAFMQTGGLPDALFDAYQREWPFEPGYERRRPALQLHKLLVGLRHFGPVRLPRIEAVLDHYGW
jgi:fructosamine-3-kinase